MESSLVATFLILFFGIVNQIFKGDAPIPKWLSQGAKNLIKRILDPNPQTRITMAEIKEDEWFKQNYTPTNPDEEEDLESDDTSSDDEVLTIHEVVCLSSLNCLSMSCIISCLLNSVIISSKSFVIYSTCLSFDNG